MKAVLELQKALTKNYYLTIIDPYNNEFECDIYSQIVKYNGLIYIENGLDEIDNKRKVLLKEIKELYNNATAEILGSLSGFENNIQKKILSQPDN